MLKLSISKWILLLSNYYGNLDELVELACECIDIINHENDLNNQNTNIINMPSKADADKREKVQCHAAKRDGNRCSVYTTSTTKLCARHQGKEVIEWESPKEEKNEETRVDLSNKIILRKDTKTGFICWPERNFIVKSFEEVYVIGKQVSNDTCVPLSEADVEYCEQNKIPYKVQDLSFKGEALPPKEVILRELKKLSEVQVYVEDLEIND